MALMLDKIFLIAFEEWNPTSMVDILNIDCGGLLSIIRCLREHRSYQDNTKRLIECNEKLKQIIEKWHAEFICDQFSVVELNKTLDNYGPEVWTQLSGFADFQLPSEENIREKIHEFAELRTSLLASLSIEDEPIYSMLQEYNAYMDDGSVLHGLFEKYKCLFRKFPGVDSMPLADIQKHDKILTSFRVEKDTNIRIANHFRKSGMSSIIFLDSLEFGTGKPMSVTKFLSEKIDSAVCKVCDLFRESSKFRFVLKAVKVVKEGGGNMQQEMSILKSCEDLNISSEGLVRFCLSATLAETLPLLKSFINFCKQYHLAIVGSNSFTKLEAQLDGLREGIIESRSIKQCNEEVHGLVQLLFPENDELTIQEIGEILKSLSPLLVLFEGISLRSNTWKLAQEFEWFGTNGLRQFYKEYGNVTNVLLGDSASYEMSVLNSLEQAMRCLSVVGGLQSAATLTDFFGPLQKKQSEIIRRTVKSTLDDLEVVQTNFSSIRDWFTNGMDDMAAIFSTFQHVWDTGEYAIQKTGFSSVSLHLNYHSGSRDNFSTVSLTGKVLRDFVQQLGFIQHESILVSGRVRSFIDQHQILDCAANNITAMVQVGYEDASCFSFHEVSQPDLSAAKHILMKSKEELTKCEGWLLDARSRHRLSLLFWFEELKCMSSCLDDIFSMDRDEIKGSSSFTRLTETASRIIPSCNRATWNDRERCEEAAEAVITEMQNNSSSPFWGWLLQISTFIERWHESIGCPRSKHESMQQNRSKAVVHTLNCDEDKKNDLVLCILQQIYEVCLTHF